MPASFTRGARGAAFAKEALAILYFRLFHFPHEGGRLPKVSSCFCQCRKRAATLVTMIVAPTHLLPVLFLVVFMKLVVRKPNRTVRKRSTTTRTTHNGDAARKMVIGRIGMLRTEELS